MNREALTAHIQEAYGIEPDAPFAGDAASLVFRHRENRKWFALMMNVSRKTLGLSGDGRVDILNVRCDPLVIGALRGAPGFLPAYHMNKDRWMTLLLDGSAGRGDIVALVAMSYDLTAPRPRRTRQREMTP